MSNCLIVFNKHLNFDELLLDEQIKLFKLYVLGYDVKVLVDGEWVKAKSIGISNAYKVNNKK